MNESDSENISDLVPPQAEPAHVDAGKVRRKSIMDGAWRGLKRGLMWGGIGGLGIGAVGGAVSMFAVKTGVSTAPAIITGISSALAWIGTVGGLPGKAVAGAGFFIMGLLGIKALAAGAAAVAAPGATAMAALYAAASVAVPIIGITLAAGAVIGATWGAISGYMESDSKVEQEQRKAAQVAAQLNFERQRVMKEILQEREMERQFDAQSRQLAGNTPGIGNLQSPNTPARGTQDNGLDQNPRGWG